MTSTSRVASLMVALSFGVASVAAAQATAPASSAAAPAAAVKSSPWSVEVGLGFDNSISGNINSSGIGHLQGQAAAITKNTYESVYGTGLHLRFGGGYKLDDTLEVRATFSFQSLDADLAPMGDLGVSRLYAQYDDYQDFTLDVGLRRYHRRSPRVQTYGEATIGVGFINDLNVQFVAPGANLANYNSDFYDQTAAFAVGGNVGVLFETSPRVGVFGQLGVRWVSGMSAVDDLQGTGLETINDKSARWTVPFLVGVRVGF